MKLDEKLAIRSMLILGEIAEIDLNFALGKFDSVQAWKLTQKALRKK